jgi:hypothetical protein
MKTCPVLARGAISFCAALALSAGTPLLSAAQTTIPLEGTLRGTAGQVVPSASVSVVDPTTNVTRTARSGSAGQFRVLGLQPGRYNVTVRAIGYVPVTQPVELIIGQRANIIITLEKAATELTAVMVTSEHMTNVEVQRTSVSAPVIREQIENLPTSDRNVMTLASITPGIKSFAPQAGRALPSAGAVPDLRFINFYMDGIELKSLFNGNLVGIPQTGAPLPQESVQEFRVFLNPYDAEYSHAGAYVISAISNRGTNTTSGSAFGYLQNKSMVARTVFQTTTPNFNRQQLGLNLRGALQKNRLFYAANYEVTNTANYIDVVPGKPTFNPAIWDSYRGSQKAPNLNHTGFARVTFEQSPRSTIDAEWAIRRMTGESNFGGTVARDGGIDQKYFINVAQVRHRYLPRPSLLNELSLQLVNWNHDEGQLVPGPQLNYPSIVLGTATFPLKLNERHLRFIDRVTYTRDNWHGDHLFKGGVEISHIAADQFSPNFLQGSFRFAVDTSTVPNQATVGVGFPNPEGTGDALAEASGWVTGVYLNDEWRMSPNFTVNLGLRYDAELNTLNNDFTVPWASDTAVTNKAVLADFINRGDRKNDLNNFSPRFSFSWDPTGMNRTFIRGGAGIIYDRVASFIGFQEKLAASWRTYTISNPGTTDVETLRQRVISGQVASTPNLVLVKNLMKTPENRQMSVGIGHQVTPDLALNADFIHQDIRHLYTRLNPNYRSTTANARVLTPRYGDIILWDDFGRAKFDALMLSVGYRRASLITNLAYTLGYYKADYDAVTAPAYPFRETYNLQRTAGDERHRLVLSEVATLPWGIELSSIATLASPRPYGVTLGVDVNKDDNLTDDFLPDGGVTGDRTVRPSNDWENWYRNLDIRVGKKFNFTGTTSVRLTAEVFNVFNTNNVAGFFGREKDAAGNPIATYGTANAAFGARRAQVGTKVEF